MTDTLPAFNGKLADEVVAYLEEHPEQHDQSIWLNEVRNHPCKTTGCVAGWALVFGKPKTMSVMQYQDAVADTVGIGEGLWTGPARHLLGLTKEEAVWVFTGGNTLGVIKVMFDAIRQARAAGRSLGNDEMHGIRREYYFGHHERTD